MDPFTILQLGGAAAGLASSFLGAGKKSDGAAQNKAAQDAITREQLQRQKEQDQKAYEIAKWYNTENAGLADETQANSQHTIANADGAYIAGRRGVNEATRAASGNALLDGSAAPTNYSDNAPDATGAVKSENARQLVKALDLGRARNAASAKVNAYGDSLMDANVNIGQGNQGQQVINRKQSFTDKTANLRNNLNVNEHVPVLSPDAQYKLAMGAGADDYNMGSMIQTGGNVLSALGANGVGQDWFNGLFQGAVPTKAGVMGPQMPGFFGGLV